MTFNFLKNVKSSTVKILSLNRDNNSFWEEVLISSHVVYKTVHVLQI